MNVKEEEQPIQLRLFQRLFRKTNQEKKRRRQLRWEENKTPMQLVFLRFWTNKTAMLGTIAFLSLLLLVLIVPMIHPLQVSDQEVTQQNVPPGRNLMKVPRKLKGNIEQIGVGATFSVGLSKEGDIYLWGKYLDSIGDIPKGMGRIAKVSAGRNHILALNSEGRLYAWGSNRFGQIEIPNEVLLRKDVVQIQAGDQCSMVVTADGTLYYWGNRNLMDYAADAYQGKIAKVVSNTNCILGLLKDGTVAYLGKRESALSHLPTFYAKVVDLAITAQNGYALDQNGRVYQWGESGRNTPESMQAVHETMDDGERIVQIESGRSHVVARTEHGVVLAWGDNQYGQTKIPRQLKQNITIVSNLFCGSYQNYAITQDGEIVTWGLKGYVFGTDGYGRDLFTRMMSGGRFTMTIGAVAVLLQTLIGVLVGGISGYYGGKVDQLCMRVTEVIQALPFLPFAMILSSLIGNRLTSMQRIYLIMVILGVLNWPGMARLVRAQVLAEKNKEFVLAAKAVGVGQGRIIWHHILPNVMSYVLISATTSFAVSMLTESSLSFLGFGVTEPNPTWGNMLTGSQSSIIIRTYWWRWVYPALALSIATISINLVGDGLRDAMDPK